MATRSFPWRGVALVVAAAAAPLVAHDNDPKIRWRQAPVNGPGYRAANPTPGQTALASGGFSADGVNLEAWVPLNQIDGADTGNDCWGYTSPSGREYAIIGTSDGTAFYEVTNPGNPTQVGYVSGPNSLWRDMKTYDTYCYIVSEGGSGIQVVNMANIDNGTVTLVNTVTGPGTDASHNVAIDEVSGFLYRLGGGSEGLRAYNLSNPANPNYVGGWNTRYIHDAQFVTYTSGPLTGTQVCFACGGFNSGFQDTGLTVLNVTNKNNIQVMDQAYYNNPAYSHQGWLSEDLQTFYLGDEIDEDGSTPSTLHVFDVSDPSNVVHQGEFDNGLLATTHNLYTKGDLLYAANYRSGLRVFDLSTSATNPDEVYWFDTYPGSNADGYNGLWSVYPYFDSGTIIGSDLERGLFVWSLDIADITVDLVGSAPDYLDPAGDTVDVVIGNPGALASADLVYDIGGGATTVPLVPTGGSNYRADFPGLPCNTIVDWYIEADDTSGNTVRHPSSAPTFTHTSVVAQGVNTIVDHQMEANQGWTSGAPGDTASTGIWTRGNPIGTDAQPEDDHSPAGNACWFTGQGTQGGSIGENDVDGGDTTLLSPTYDLSSASDPTVSFWVWYSNAEGASPNDDIFVVDLSGNGGGSWTNVLTLGPSGAGTNPGWFQYSFRVADYMPPTANMQLRFIAEDANSGSIVEAAVDDLVITDTVCSDEPGSNYCVATVNSSGQAAFSGGLGSNVVADNNFTVTADLMAANKFGYFVASLTQGFVQPPGSQGNLCLAGQIRRYNNNVMNTGPFGSFALAIDLTSIPGHGAVSPGETWNFQAWFRDNNPGQTSNFTDGYSVLFQ